MLEKIDAAGTRSTILRAEPDAGVTTDVLSRINSLQDTEQATRIGRSFDVRTTAFDDIEPVPMRTIYQLDHPHVTSRGMPGDASASPGAAPPSPPPQSASPETHFLGTLCSRR